MARVLMPDEAPPRFTRSAPLDKTKSTADWLRTIGSQSAHRPGRLRDRSLDHLGWLSRKTNKIHPAARDDLPVTFQHTPVLVKYLRKVERPFRAAIERLYAAHIEKVQMRLAPTRDEYFSPPGLPPFFFTPTSRPRREDRIAD